MLFKLKIIDFGDIRVFGDTNLVTYSIYDSSLSWF